MRQTLERVADRLVSVIVPKTTAGACACGPWDNGWVDRGCERCWASYNCWCKVTYSQCYCRCC